MPIMPSSKRICKAREFFNKTIKEIVDEHVSTFDPGHLRDYIDGYLSQAYKLDKSGEKHTFTSKFILINVSDAIGIFFGEGKEIIQKCTDRWR